MRRRRLTIAISALFAGLFLCGGCSTFRKWFDEDPAVTRQKREQAQKRQEERERKNQDVNPFAALLNPKPKKEKPPAFESSLNEKEKAILKQSEAESRGADPDAAVDEIHRENRDRSKQMEKNTFGGGLKDWL